MRLPGQDDARPVVVARDGVRDIRRQRGRDGLDRNASVRLAPDVAAGVLVTSITIQTRARSVLLPVLLLPLILPLVLSAASGVASFMVDTPPELAEVTSNFAIVAAYDLLMLTVGVLTYNYVVEG